jgi:hypothetical protein
MILNKDNMTDLWHLDAEMVRFWIPAIQVGEIGREKMFVQPTTCPSRKFSLQLTGLSPSSCRTVELSSSGEGNRLQTIHNKYSRM